MWQNVGLEKLKGKTVITGFHGIGFVGFIALDFMVRKLEAKRVDWYFNNNLPPVVFAGKDKLHPHLRLRLVESWKKIGSLLQYYNKKRGRC